MRRKIREGVIYEWDPSSDTYAKDLDFKNPLKLDSLNSAHGCRPYGSMVQGAGGKFYGMAIGDPAGRGHAAVFEYDPATDHYVEKNDTVSGMSWYYFSDGLTIRYFSNSDTIDVVSDESYVSPSGRYTWTVSGVYYDTIPSAAGCDSVLTLNLTINQPTGLPDNGFKSGIILYPNPTNGFFTIDLGRTYPYAGIDISQMDGRIVSRDFILNARFRDLQLSGAPGLYMVTVISGNQKAVFKISKK